MIIKELNKKSNSPKFGKHSNDGNSLIFDLFSLLMNASVAVLTAKFDFVASVIIIY